MLEELNLLFTCCNVLLTVSLTTHTNTGVGESVALDNHASNHSICHLDFFSQVEFNPNQSSLTVEGDDIDAFDKVMQHISYLNSRQFPTPGIRHLRISTTVK